jgi:5-methyltetrahydrofolate--homocysteine methyltransferase
MAEWESGAQRAGGRQLCVRDDYLQRVLDGNATLVFDGAMGTMLQQRGLQPGSLPDLMCLTSPDVVTQVHRVYVEAGSQAVTANTFGSNPDKLAGAASVDDVFAAAIACAHAAGARYVAADMGPTGTLMAPMGTLTPEAAYDIYAEQARAAQVHGADLIIVETMADLAEAGAAVRAAVENTQLPVFATMTFARTGRTIMGTTPRQAAVELRALGANAVGANCSLGPDALAPIVAAMQEVVDCPVIVQANAGMPQLLGGETVYPVGPDEYMEQLRPLLDAGVRIVGGCCGTDERYIALVARELKMR